MALGDSYATLPELKARYTEILGSAEDAALTNALAVASRGIEHVCGRQFNKTDTPSARVFHPETQCWTRVHDFHTTSGLIVATDGGGDGTYETVWAATDYQLEPLNGIEGGESGWPYYSLRAVGGRQFPCNRRASLQVTAQWGWTAVPAGVKEACLAVASETWKLKDAPFGVAGVAEWGVVRVRANPLAMAMIAPYCRDPVLIA